MFPFETKHLSPIYDCLAPDGSEIRLLLSTKDGSMVHCSLPSHQTSLAVRHRTVEEIWYCLEGRGQVWWKYGEHEEVTDVGPGIALTIPVGTHFQFRNVGEEPLMFIIVTMPPWPGDQEAVRVDDHWK